MPRRQLGKVMPNRWEQERHAKIYSEQAGAPKRRAGPWSCGAKEGPCSRPFSKSQQICWAISQPGMFNTCLLLPSWSCQPQPSHRWQANAPAKAAAQHARSQRRGQAHVDMWKEAGGERTSKQRLPLPSLAQRKLKTSLLFWWKWRRAVIAN